MELKFLYDTIFFQILTTKSRDIKKNAPLPRNQSLMHRHLNVLDHVNDTMP